MHATSHTVLLDVVNCSSFDFVCSKIDEEGLQAEIFGTELPAGGSLPPISVSVAPSSKPIKRLVIYFFTIVEDESHFFALKLQKLKNGPIQASCRLELDLIEASITCEPGQISLLLRESANGKVWLMSHIDRIHELASVIYAFLKSHREQTSRIENRNTCISNARSSTELAAITAEAQEHLILKHFYTKTLNDSKPNNVITDLKYEPPIKMLKNYTYRVLAHQLIPPFLSSVLAAPRYTPRPKLNQGTIDLCIELVNYTPFTFQFDKNAILSFQQQNERIRSQIPLLLESSDAAQLIYSVSSTTFDVPIVLRLRNDNQANSFISESEDTLPTVKIENKQLNSLQKFVNKHKILSTWLQGNQQLSLAIVLSKIEDGSDAELRMIMLHTSKLNVLGLVAHFTYSLHESLAVTIRIYSRTLENLICIDKLYLLPYSTRKLNSLCRDKKVNARERERIVIREATDMSHTLINNLVYKQAKVTLSPNIPFLKMLQSQLQKFALKNTNANLPADGLHDQIFVSSAEICPALIESSVSSKHTSQSKSHTPKEFKSVVIKYTMYPETLYVALPLAGKTVPRVRFDLRYACGLATSNYAPPERFLLDHNDQKFIAMSHTVELTRPTQTPVLLLSFVDEIKLRNVELDQLFTEFFTYEVLDYQMKKSLSDFRSAVCFLILTFDCVFKSVLDFEYHDLFPTSATEYIHNQLKTRNSKITEFLSISESNKGDEKLRRSSSHSIQTQSSHLSRFGLVNTSNYNFSFSDGSAELIRVYEQQRSAIEVFEEVYNKFLDNSLVESHAELLSIAATSLATVLKNKYADQMKEDIVRLTRLAVYLKR